MVCDTARAATRGKAPTFLTSGMYACSFSCFSLFFMLFVRSCD